LIVCVAVVLLPHKSVIVYVLVITSGHVPLDASKELTTRFASGVHTSAICIPNASSAATVVAAAGASVGPQPSTVDAGIVPVTTGASVSFTSNV
jgi:hypothetical protein